MDNFSAEIPPILKPSEPLPGPTVSAWSTPPPPEVSIPLPVVSVPTPLPRWVFGLLLLAQVGFAVIFAYMMLALGQRMDRADEATEAKLEKVMRVQEVIRTQQLIDKELVARIPGLLDTVAAMQRDLVLHSAALKVFEPQSQSTRQDVQQLRREHDLLVSRVQGLTFVPRPKIPMKERRRD